jgi:hypothetical protein
VNERSGKPEAVRKRRFGKLRLPSDRITHYAERVEFLGSRAGADDAKACDLAVGTGDNRDFAGTLGEAGEVGVAAVRRRTPEGQRFQWTEAGVRPHEVVVLGLRGLGEAGRWDGLR